MTISYNIKMKMNLSPLRCKGKGASFIMKFNKLIPELSVSSFKKSNQLLGNKEFLVKDPDGYLLRFAEDLGAKPVYYKL